MRKGFFFIFLSILLAIAYNATASPLIQPGAAQTAVYLPLLKGKRVAAFVNQTSYVDHTRLVDLLTAHGISVVKIFSPEHGVEGKVDPGFFVGNSKDTKTGIPIISLYGDKKKPTPQDLKNVDILLFDIQDVGVSFYTYISSLQKFMEAAIENDKPLIILDRPNPNGFYVDGPILGQKHRSFTVMQAIPFVYGMTEGEYAHMLVGEELLDVIPKTKAHQLKLTVVPCVNYTHKSLYEPPIKPSPNLPNIQSIYWYASLGMLEATVLSVGKGTDKPYQYFGHPLYSLPFTFKPEPNEGAQHPEFENQVCHGWDLSGSKQAVLDKIHRQIYLSFIINAYRLFPKKDEFFYAHVKKGSPLWPVKMGMNEQEIRKLWAPDLMRFKKVRKKYLLYPDFE